MNGRTDVVGVLDTAIRDLDAMHLRSSHVAIARAAIVELIDAAEYALRTRDDSGALTDTAEHNLRAALAAVTPADGEGE